MANIKPYRKNENEPSDIWKSLPVIFMILLNILIDLYVFCWKNMILDTFIYKKFDV